jgi:LPXTG-motif cell wall-anchored protein
MKKNILLIALIAIFVILPAASFANSTLTQVTGKVTYNGKAVSGATVRIVCNTYVKHTTTNKKGVYTSEYPVSRCANGRKATATATKGTETGSGSVKIKNHKGVLNIALCKKVVSVPEFSTILGIIAVLIAGGAFLTIRRRKTNVKTMV